MSSFVLTLKKGQYAYQFGQYAWTHMILMVRCPGSRPGTWAAAWQLGWHLAAAVRPAAG